MALISKINVWTLYVHAVVVDEANYVRATHTVRA